MRIMACTDGSPISTMAVQRAVILAKSFRDAKVLLVHVHQDSLYGSPILQTHMAIEIPPDLEEKMYQKSRQLLKSAEQILEKEEVEYTAHLLRGSPAERILDFAEEENIDLVVLGHKGRSGLGRVLMGSVSSTVVQQAHCDVYVVKKEP